jgi:sulfopropanediol 3-dehydrogenase
MARYLKRGMDASAIKAADARVRETVEGILAEVEAGRDRAVRALSERFDGWSPASFRLGAAEIERALELAQRLLLLLREVSHLRLREGDIVELALAQLARIPSISCRD